MNRKQLIITLALAVIVIIAVGGSTIALLNYLNKQKEVPTPTVPKEETPADEPFVEPIDETLDKQARALEAEAASLMNKEPLRAQEKYIEAGNIYEQAGNAARAGEARANAMTAGLLAEEQNTEQ